MKSTLRKLTGVFVIFLGYLSPACGASVRVVPPGGESGSTSLVVGEARLQVEFKGADSDLPRVTIEEYVRRAAQAVTVYYGRFPVTSARVVILVAAGERGVLQGTTWGAVDGYPAVTRLRIGQHTTKAQLDEDWILTHEMVHMALASLPDEQHWLEEGIATYVEPIARVEAGQIKAEEVWEDMASGMPHGEPEALDRGLNRTHTWGRTYWGGALFCFMADVAIRKQTGNVYGLQDALKAIVAAGGTIDKDWPVARILGIGDKATGTSVLQDLYGRWSDAPVDVDLASMWNQLGVRFIKGNVQFDDKAPLAQIRRRMIRLSPGHEQTAVAAGGFGR